MTQATRASRLASLDALRGLTVLAMLLVNNPGHGPTYQQVTHVPWLMGWSLADVIAPLFVWVVGVSLPLAIMPRLESGDPRNPLARRVVRRGLLLVAIGIVLAAVPTIIPLGNWDALATLRFPGVLQRIGICYMIGAAVVMTTSARTQLILALLLPVVHWSILMLVPTPGFPAGDLTPAGYLGWYVNQQVFGAHAQEFDEYGIISTLGALSSTLLGAVTGHALRRPGNPVTGGHLVLVGLVAVGLSLVLGNWIPLSRHLWSPSFVLLTAGMGMGTLGLLRLLLDGRTDVPALALPLVAVGRNALLIFVGTILLATVVASKGFVLADGTWWSINRIVTAPFAAVLPPKAATLAVSLFWGALCCALAVFLHRRKWYVVF